MPHRWGSSSVLFGAQPYALIAVDPQAAQRTVALLADMSRHAFATSQSDLIPLVQELDFVNALEGN